ncbi:hypothetical protein KPZU09_57240 [Klebsiella pneumoniae]|uniref:Uncharacterized protein n=1 Tax=Klebsiella pneumoniae TaxID=573 RepID=A0A919HYZ3_KLEPN|nr:hypothetical protein KPZU09_57240 [Klebsiella pneumoniae]
MDAARHAQIIHQRLLQFRGAAVAAIAEPLRFGPTADAGWILLNSGWGKALTSGTPGINAPHWRGLALTAEQMLASA